LKEINLLPPSILNSKKRRKKVVFCFLVILFVAVILVEGYYFVLEKVKYVNSKVQQVEAQLNEHEILLQKKGFSREEAQQVVKQLNIYNELVNQKIFLSEVFTEIENIIPKGIQLRDVSFYNDKKIVLKGFALSNIMIAQFIAGLENSPLFKDVNLSFINTQNQLENKILYFQIVCSINNGGKK